MADEGERRVRCRIHEDEVSVHDHEVRVRAILQSLTPEQRAVVRAVRDRRGHVSVNACPGSGKTTLVVALIKILQLLEPHARIFVVQFNRQMTTEIRARLAGCGLDDQCVRTHSSLHYRLLRLKDNGGAPSERQVLDLAKMQLHETPGSVGEFDYVIVDEAQDLSADDWRILARHVARVGVDGVSSCKARLLLVGDERQSIYGGLRRADARFLSQLSRLLHNPRDPVHGVRSLQLTVTHRNTPPMVDFVNLVVLHAADPSTHMRASDRALESHDHRPVIALLAPYNRQKSMDSEKHAVLHFLQSAFEAGARPGDCLVLAPSIKKRYGQLLHELECVDVGAFRDVSLRAFDAECGEIDEMHHVRFATFHRVKGLEARFVLVFGVDDAYTAFYDTDTPLHETPPALFVALTRAKEQLFFYANSSSEAPPSFSLQALNELARDARRLCVRKLIDEEWIALESYEINVQGAYGRDIDKDKPQPVCVTELLDNANECDFERALQHVETITRALQQGRCCKHDLKALRVNGCSVSFARSALVGKLVVLMYERYALRKTWAQCRSFRYIELSLDALICNSKTPVALVNKLRAKASPRLYQMKCDDRLFSDVGAREEHDYLLWVAAVAESSHEDGDTRLLDAVHALRGLPTEPLLTIEGAVDIAARVQLLFDDLERREYTLSGVEQSIDAQLLAIAPLRSRNTAPVILLQGRVDAVLLSGTRKPLFVEFKLSDGGSQKARVRDVMQVATYAAMHLKRDGSVDCVEVAVYYVLSGRLHEFSVSRTEAERNILPALVMARARWSSQDLFVAPATPALVAWSAMDSRDSDAFISRERAFLCADYASSTATLDHDSGCTIALLSRSTLSKSIVPMRLRVERVGSERVLYLQEQELRPQLLVVTEHDWMLSGDALSRCMVERRASLQSRVLGADVVFCTDMINTLRTLIHDCNRVAGMKDDVAALHCARKIDFHDFIREEPDAELGDDVTRAYESVEALRRLLCCDRVQCDRLPAPTDRADADRSAAIRCIEDALLQTTPFDPLLHSYFDRLHESLQLCTNADGDRLLLFVDPASTHIMSTYWKTTFTRANRSLIDRRYRVQFPHHPYYMFALSNDLSDVACAALAVWERWALTSLSVACLTRAFNDCSLDRTVLHVDMSCILARACNMRGDPVAQGVLKTRATSRRDDIFLHSLLSCEAAVDFDVSLHFVGFRLLPPVPLAGGAQQVDVEPALMLLPASAATAP